MSGWAGSLRRFLAYDRTIELNPDKPKVWNNRGAMLGNLRMFDEALESDAEEAFGNAWELG
ncbi:MAG TPA: tetratricopeptide repeat protein [Methanotrichaceae archaeon]|nr:tetratricopeptide repeat protein [Methanotrichaceae archaeon]